MSFSFQNDLAEIHLWRCSLESPIRGLNYNADKFTPGERKRMSAFLCIHDRNRYLTVHTYLREILSYYLIERPWSIRFLYSRNSKPRLKQHPGYPEIYFNLSYRDEFMLLGISNSAWLGVDLERVRDMDNISGFSEIFFSMEEQQCILSKCSMEKQLSFLYTLWSMKEAVVKSMGLGMTKPFDQFNVSPFLDKKLHAPDFDRGNSWYVSPVDFDPKYKAAVAVRAKNVKIEALEFN